MNAPRVSVVIPHFNRAALLKETLGSIASSSLEDWEVVIVDDGSQPHELEEVRALASERVRVLQRTDGAKGPSRCRNIGLNHASSDHVIFVDSDDLMAPWCLEQRLAKVAQDPNFDFWVFPVLLFVEVMGDSRLQWNRIIGEDPLSRFICSDPPWHTSSAVWRKDALLSLGGFNEAVMYGDDTDLHIRALLCGTRFSTSAAAMADVFVRRTDAPRITNTISSGLLRSRRRRLSEGSRVIASADSEHRVAWQGQYLAECEFLLFNVEPARGLICEIFQDWKRNHPGSSFRRSVSRVYLEIALATRTRCYFVLRLARRIAMLVLPRSYFPEAKSFHHEQISESEQQRIKQRITASCQQRREDM